MAEYVTFIMAYMAGPQRPKTGGRSRQRRPVAAAAVCRRFRVRQCRYGAGRGCVDAPSQLYMSALSAPERCSALPHRVTRPSGQS